MNRKYKIGAVLFILTVGMFAFYKMYSSRAIIWHIENVDIKEIASIEVVYRASSDGLFYASPTSSLVGAEAYGEVLQRLEELQYTYYADESNQTTSSKLSDRGYSFQESLSISIYERNGESIQLCLRQNAEKKWSFMELQLYSQKGIKDRKLYKVDYNQGSQYIDWILELCNN